MAAPNRRTPSRLSDGSPRSAAKSRYCHGCTPHTSGSPAESTRTASSKPPLRTRSTDVVSSISAKASRSLVISTERQPRARASAAELASTSSASYAAGTTVQRPAAAASRARHLLDQSAGFSGDALVLRVVGPARRVVGQSKPTTTASGRRYAAARREADQPLQRPHRTAGGSSRPSAAARDSTVQQAVAVEASITPGIHANQLVLQRHFLCLRCQWHAGIAIAAASEA